MKDEILKVSQSGIAQALAADYFCIYYVNVENDKFIEYSSSEEYRSLHLPKTGDDFISFSRVNFDEHIYPEDREGFLDRFTKENVIESLDRSGVFTMTFRMVFREDPVYVHLKITRMIEEEKRHVVVGISSVDEQMKAREAFENARHASITYSRVAQALAGDYFSIYVVDPDSGHFFEYSSTAEYEQLEVEKEGEDFFGISRKNMSRVIYPEDKERFLGTFYKDKVMNILERDGSFTMKYRLVVTGEPVYVSMKATLLEDEHGRHLIIGTNNIDAQMKREEAYRKSVAEARDRAKNDFLANMSHDMRTPMNAIVGFTNIARDHLDDPEIVKDALAKISSSNHFLLSLINDVLDISKIESGKMQLNSADCDLAALFRRIEDITLLQARQKSLQISYHKDSIRHFRVRTDELRLEQVLINIISNAIKYTPEGKSVELRAEEEASPLEGRYRYRFIIRDTGIGISEEYLPHIFESFTREESTTINRIQGTGLGLAITARIVELMEGMITVDSKVNEGSTFTVVLDLEAAAGEEETAAKPAAPLSLQGKKILVVEDNDINAEIALMVLQQFGADAQRAENGKAGLQQVQEEEYAAVLMDIQMPVMNGYEATEAIRRLGGRYRTLPIIAMSANAYEDDVKACLASGMNDHIAKPFDPQKLIELLQKYID